MPIARGAGDSWDRSHAATAGRKPVREHAASSRTAASGQAHTTLGTAQTPVAKPGIFPALAKTAMMPGMAPQPTPIMPQSGQTASVPGGSASANLPPPPPQQPPSQPGQQPPSGAPPQGGQPGMLPTTPMQDMPPAPLPAHPLSAQPQRAVAASHSPEGPPRDAAWGERYFHLIDPKGHELRFAKPLPKGENARNAV